MKVTTIRKRPIAGRYLCKNCQLVTRLRRCFVRTALRFEGLAQGIQLVFNLASLFSDLVERRRIVRRGTRLIAELIVQAQIVARSASYLRHDLFAGVKENGVGGEMLGRWWFAVDGGCTMTEILSGERIVEFKRDS